MISVLILTRDEERNLPECIRSVAWSDDILVIDSFSTDNTVRVAQQLGARVLQRNFDSFSGQRNFGLDQGVLRHPWVLHLDADEQISGELQRELMETAKCAEKDAYRLASKMMFQGRWLKYSGMYPAYQVRFGKRDSLRFVEVGHGQREAIRPERIGTLQNPLIHYSFSKGLHAWFEKHNRYSTAEAKHQVETEGMAPLNLATLLQSDRTERRRAWKQLSFKLPFRPLLRFLYMYFLRRGFLDGAAGYEYCRLVSIYEYMIVIKSRELARTAVGSEGRAVGVPVQVQK